MDIQMDNWLTDTQTDGYIDAKYLNDPIKEMCSYSSYTNTERKDQYKCKVVTNREQEKRGAAQ